MITARGSFRRLTPCEITLSRFLYKNAIDYSLVKVHNASYFPFGLQNEETAVTPNGELYWPKNTSGKIFPQKQRATYGGSCMKWPTYGSIRWG